MGGSGGNKAQDQADANERERQAQIAASTGKINAVFDSPERQAEYAKLTDDTTKFFTNDVNKQKTFNDRQLKFALARNGNNGGSVQVDKSKTLGDDYLKGIIEASRKGQAAGANLQSADESSRGNLLALAQTGLDATTAGSQAASSIRSNLASNQASATADQLGNLFGDLGTVYSKSEDAKALRQGQKYAYNTVYQPMFGAGATSGYGGGY